MQVLFLLHILTGENVYFLFNVTLKQQSIMAAQRSICQESAAAARAL